MPHVTILNGICLYIFIEIILLPTKIIEGMTISSKLIKIHIIDYYLDRIVVGIWLFFYSDASNIQLPLR